MPRWACLALLAFGCGHPASSGKPSTTTSAATSPAPAPPPHVDAPRPPLADDLPQLALRARQLYKDWAAAFADPNTDCAKATASMTELADKNADVLAANEQVMKDGHERIKQLRAEVEKYEDEMGPIAKSIIHSPIMSRCSNDAVFGQAVDRLAGEH